MRRPFFLFDEEHKVERPKKKSINRLPSNRGDHEMNLSVVMVISELYYSYHGNILLVSNTLDQHRPLTEKKVNKAQKKCFKTSYGVSFKSGSMKSQK